MKWSTLTRVGEGTYIEPRKLAVLVQPEGCRTVRQTGRTVRAKPGQSDQWVGLPTRSTPRPPRRLREATTSDGPVYTPDGPRDRLVRWSGVQVERSGLGTDGLTCQPRQSDMGIYTTDLGTSHSDGPSRRSNGPGYARTV